MVSAKEVSFFGGMSGEPNNSSIFILNLLTNAWQNVIMKSSIQSLGRDDHAGLDYGNGVFMCFGGYVNGDRVNEILTCKH